MAGSFNMLVAPNAGGLFLGDYVGLATAGTAFRPFFTQTSCANSSCAVPNDPTDIVTASF